MPARYQRRKAPTKRLNKLEKKVSSILKNQEHKFVDLTAEELSTSDSWASTQLNAITQGDSAITRDGAKITMNRIDIRGKISAGDATNYVRLLLVLFKDQGATQSITDVLQLSTDLVTYPSRLWSPKKRNGHSLYEVMHDKVYSVSGVSDPTIQFRIKKKFKSGGQSVVFDTAGLAQQGRLYLFRVSDSNAATHPTVTMFSRLDFIDA